MKTASLKRVLKEINEGKKIASCFNWSIILGGYDRGYEVYYRGGEVIRVNYELKEYQWLDKTIAEEFKENILQELECSSFKEILC